MPTYDPYNVSESLVRRAAYLNDFRVATPLPDAPGEPQYFQVFRLGGDFKAWPATPFGWVEAMEWMQAVRQDIWTAPEEVATVDAGYLPMLLDPNGARIKAEVFRWQPDKPGIGDRRQQQREVYRVHLAGTAHRDHATAYVLTRGAQILLRAFRLPLLVGCLDMIGIPLTGWQRTNEYSQYINSRLATPFPRKEI